MIVLDTHIWIFWVHGDSRLSSEHADLIAEHEESIIGVSAISCWEIAKLVELGRVTLSRELEEWLMIALDYPGVRLLDLTPEIAVESTRLPGEFHRDPADQIIVATARIDDCPLLTNDQKIRDYSYVDTP